MKKKAAKRNPQDATRRNVQAANKKIFNLDARLSQLEAQAHDSWASGAQLANLELRVVHLEKVLEDKPQ